MNKKLPRLTKKQKLEVVKEFFADDYPLIKSILDAQRATQIEDKIGKFRTMLVGMSLAWLLLTCVVVALY